jgi:pyruvate dehydrogenase E1 component alpha subunit
MRGHYEPDDQSYVDPKELSAWESKDPIERYKNRLLRDGILNEEDIRRLQQRVHNTIERAIEFANSSAFPDVTELMTEVYA